MKFMVMHKHDANTEVGTPPPPELVQKMGALIGGMAQSGKLLDGEGLGATKTRSRVSIREGGAKVDVAHGPYTPTAQELPTAFAKITVASRDEAIAYTTNLGKAMGGNVDFEVGKLQEPWDIGFGEKPENAKERYLLIQKATNDTEAGHPSNIEAACKEVKEKGEFLTAATLTPSSKAKRLNWRGEKQTVTDGPFSETKELIGGYAILDMASMEECVAFCGAYAQILLSVADTLEIDIRPL